MKEKFDDFMKKIIKPKLLKTLTPVSINVAYKDSEIIIETFGFFTVSDLKLAIYEMFDREPFAAPNNQLIFIDKKVGIDPIDFTWRAPLLKTPISDTINNNFVNPDGSKRNVAIILNDNILLENKLKDNNINLLLYSDILKNISDVKPISEKVFNGKIAQYFPFLKHNLSYPSENDLKSLSLKLEYFNRKVDYINKIESLLSSGEPIIEPVFGGLRFLKFSWPINPFKEGAETFFYDIDVNETRPYLRLLTSENTAISKVHLKDIENKIPNIFNINYLSDWSEEKNPTPERNFIMGKIALRSTLLNLPYIYGTLRILDDGSFDVIIEPPKPIRKLKLDTDFDDFSEDFVNGIETINRENKLPSLSSGNFVFGLQLPATAQIITRKQFEKRIMLLRPFFQEISALPNEQPFFMLRYKCVNNFITEDNISNFLTQLTNKKIVKGEESVSELISYISEEFQLDMETARQKVSDWLTKRDEVQQVLIGETKDYTPVNNTGVDISIFQKKNLYTFHLYNVDSFITLERILSFLSLVLSLSDIDLKVSEKKIKEFEVLEQATKPLVEESSSDSAKNNGDASSLPDFEDDLMFDDSESVDSPNVKEIRERIRDDVKAPDEELRDVQLVKPKVASAEETTKGVANFFIQKLKDIDRSLFDFPTKHPSDLGYVQACAANEMRQPAALTQEQYTTMIEEYEGDDVDFRVYPPNEGDNYEVPNKASDPNKIVTVLRYRNNYYVCSELFCTRDEIVVLKKDFVGTKLRRSITDSEGNEITTKPPNTCPFCFGKLIVNRKNPGANETVLQRIYKPKTEKRHVWVNFLKKSSHPNGWQLPCCFVSPSAIEYKDLGKGEYEKYKPKTEEDEEEEFFTGLESGHPYPYTLALSRIQKKYIVGDVIPLDIGDRDGPQIGLLPKQLNELFEQDPATIVGRTGSLQKVLPNAKGFLRIGVENKKRFQGDSFLSAIAPFFGRDSAKQMKQRILEVIVPRVFVTMNYGNLMLEFYSPTDKTIPKRNLERWAKEKLDIIYNDNNALEVERIYKSFAAFEKWLLSDQTTKEFRQFGMILSQSSLVQQGISRAGITFIVIDMNEDSTISIRCPSYGYNNSINAKNDVAFLFHHYSGIWEPIFYVNNIITGLVNIEPYQLLFQRANYDSWPPVVKKLLLDYSQNCSGPSRTIFTSQTHVNSDSLIPLSFALRVFTSISQKYPNFYVSGVLRDAYNHVFGIVCEEERADKNYQVLVPVIDDGVFYMEYFYLNYNEIKFESFENTLRILNKYILPSFPRFKYYKPVAVAKNSSTEEYVAIVLQNRLLIPIKPSSSISAEIKTVSIGDFEFVINRAIAFEEENLLEDINKQVLEERELNEIYEHLRLTFANLVSQLGSSFRSVLEEDIIERDDLTLNEKRKRMIVLLGNLVMSWFSTREQDDSQISVLRKDCTIQSKSTCSDKCVWLEDSGCKIHVKEKYKKVNMATLLMLRLFDEILRFSEQRKQIFENEISRLVLLNEPIFIKDQYILPENSLEWSELLRSESFVRQSEASRFFEEFSSKHVAEKEESDELFDIPDNVKSFLQISQDSDLKFLIVSNEKSLSPVLSYMGVDDKDIKYNGKNNTFETLELVKLGQDLQVNSFVIQINALQEQLSIKRLSTINDKKPIIILLITNEGNGFIVKNTSSYKLQYSEVPVILLPQ